MDDARSRSTGVPTLRVRTRCEHTGALIERYARDVGPSGVFVRTRDVFEAGTLVRFEYLLADGRCGLAGEGRVAFRRVEDEGGGAAAGVGIAFDKLRQGDRAIVERMRAARGAMPSRFEQPERASSVPPRSSLRAETLFADVKIADADAAEGIGAFLSADLTSDLPTVRPPVSTPAPGSSSAPAAVDPAGADWSADLADQLEPAPERPSALDAVEADADATPAFVPLDAPTEGRDEPEDPESSRASSAGWLRAEIVPSSVTRASDPGRQQRLVELLTRAAREDPPGVPVRISLPVGVLLVLLALLGLGLLVSQLDPWLLR